jgi:hypothetical protein
VIFLTFNNVEYCVSVFSDEKQRKEIIQKIRTGRERVTPEIQAISSQYETFKSAYADLMAVLRGDSQPPNFVSDAPSTVDSKYGGSVAASSQASQDLSDLD